MTRAQTTHYKAAFLESFRKRGIILAACRETGVTRDTVRFWRTNDPKFEAAYLEAEIESTEVMEQEALRRGVDGLTRKKFDKGEPLIDPETGRQYVEREYSDSLLMFMLKARKPSTYREPRQGSAPEGLGVPPEAMAADA